MLEFKSIEWTSFAHQFNKLMYLLQANLEISLPLEACAPTSLCCELFPAHPMPAAYSFIHPHPSQSVSYWDSNVTWRKKLSSFSSPTSKDTYQ